MAGWGNAFDTFGGLNTSSISNAFNNGFNGGWSNIPGLSNELNNMFAGIFNQINTIQNQTKHPTSNVNQLISTSYEKALQSSSAQSNTAIKNLYSTLDSVQYDADDFVGSQVGMLATSGLDPSIVASFASAASKGNAGQYNQVFAQAQKAMQMQRDFFDYTDSKAGTTGNLQELFEQINARDFNGTYGTALSDTIGDLVGKLSTIQTERTNLQSQANALMGAAAMQRQLETAKTLLGADDVQTTGDANQTADVAISTDVSHQKKTGSLAVDGRGGGRYVTTTTGAGSGLQI